MVGKVLGNGRKTDQRSTADEHAIQRRSILLSIETHLKNLQENKRLCEMVIRLQVQRGGTINRVRKIKYVAEYDYPEGEESVATV